MDCITIMQNRPPIGVCNSGQLAGKAQELHVEFPTTAQGDDTERAVMGPPAQKDRHAIVCRNSYSGAQPASRIVKQVEHLTCHVDFRASSTAVLQEAHMVTCSL